MYLREREFEAHQPYELPRNFKVAYEQSEKSARSMLTYHKPHKNGWSEEYLGPRPGHPDSYFKEAKVGPQIWSSIAEFSVGAS